jgi:hypothetical protein
MLNSHPSVDMRSRRHPKLTFGLLLADSRTIELRRRMPAGTDRELDLPLIIE